MQLFRPQSKTAHNYDQQKNRTYLRRKKMT